MIGAFGGLAVITLVIVKGAEAIFNIDLVSLLDNLPTVSMGVLIAIAIIIALLMLLGPQLYAAITSVQSPKISYKSFR